MQRADQRFFSETALVAKLKASDFSGKCPFSGLLSWPDAVLTITILGSGEEWPRNQDPPLMTTQEIMGRCQLLLTTACLWLALQHSSPSVSPVTLPLIGLKYLDEFGMGMLDSLGTAGTKIHICLLCRQTKDQFPVWSSPIHWLFFHASYTVNLNKCLLSE